MMDKFAAQRLRDHRAMLKELCKWYFQERSEAFRQRTKREMWKRARQVCGYKESDNG